MNVDSNKPAINVYCFHNIKDEFILNNILWGIEEEGIPYSLEKQNEECSINLSYSACKKSKFGVGIGIGNDLSICFHYEKLDLDNYLFKINSESSEEKLRAIGANAARLIKRVSFKEL